MAGPLALVAMSVAVLAASSCSVGDDGPSASADDGTNEGSTEVKPAEPSGETVLGVGDGTFEVRYESFVDTSRHTGSVPNRVLETDVYVPGGEGPFPLVVHAHGFDGSAAKFSALLGAWAAAGYAVVAPNFPLTNDGVAEVDKDLGDYVNQPADVRFALDSVLEMNETGGELEGLISTDHMGISGLSLGGATTYPSLFHPCCADDRYRSAILMSALELPFEPGEYDYAGARPFPVLAFAGTSDDAIPYELQQSIIAGLPGPTWSVTLIEGEHATPFENPDSPFDEMVVASTIDFWDMTLREDPSAGQELEADAAIPGLSTLEIRP
jgi:dienelactone hydrolase